MGVTFLSKMVSKRVRSGTSERAASLINTLLGNPGYLGKKQVRFRSRPKSPCKEEKSLQSLACVVVAERGEGGGREKKAEPPHFFSSFPLPFSTPARQAIDPARPRQ